MKGAEKPWFIGNRLNHEHSESGFNYIQKTIVSNDCVYIY